jgi:hypothetical protein
MVNWHNWHQIKSGVHSLLVLKLYSELFPNKKVFYKWMRNWFQSTIGWYVFVKPKLIISYLKNTGLYIVYKIESQRVTNEHV